MEKVYTLDKLDKKILKALMGNARYSYSAIAKMAGTKREVVTYRIKRLVDNRIIEQFTTSLFRPGISFELTPHIYLKIGIVTNDRLKEIINELEQYEYIIRVAECEGAFNLHIMPLCKNEYHLRKVLDDIKQICSLDLLDYEIMDVVIDNYAHGFFFLGDEDITLKKVVDKGGSFQSVFSKSYHKKDLPRPRNLNLSYLDLKILDILEGQSRIPLIDIAKKTNSELMTVKNRIKYLIQKKLIHKFNLIINPKKLGYQEYHLMIRLHGSEEEQKKVITLLRENKSCYYLALCNGKWDFLFRYQVKDSKSLKNLMNEVFSKYSNVLVKYEILWITKTYKNYSYPNSLTKVYHEKPFTSLAQTLNK